LYYCALQQSSNFKSTECQTDPVKDEVFDWDLSDKTDCETQTVPPTRANSTLGGGIIYSYTANFDLQFQDAIVQTDQRLAFLLRRSSTRAGHKLSGSGVEGEESFDDDSRSRSNEGALSSLSQGNIYSIVGYRGTNQCIRFEYSLKCFI
jgi:hypothetical protein